MDIVGLIDTIEWERTGLQQKVMRRPHVGGNSFRVRVELLAAQFGVRLAFDEQHHPFGEDVVRSANRAADSHFGFQ